MILLHVCPSLDIPHADRTAIERRILFQEASRQRGCQDARELLRYEAVVLEQELHQTLVEVNGTQSLLEEGRVQAAER